MLKFVNIPIYLYGEMEEIQLKEVTALSLKTALC